MAKKRKLKYTTLVYLLVVFAIAAASIPSLFGLPGRINIQVTDENGVPLKGVRCQADTKHVNAGTTSQLVYDSTSAAGWCYFTGTTWPSGEIYGWGVSCNNPSGLTDQGSVTVQSSNLYSLTSNVFVELPGCKGSDYQKPTTTTIPTDPNYDDCEKVKCYNGDEWCWDSNNKRADKHRECGTPGCSGGSCTNLPKETTTTVKQTTTTIKQTTTTLKTVQCTVDSHCDEGLECVNGMCAIVQRDDENEDIVMLIVAAVIAVALVAAYLFNKNK
jgi:hypothetical protein